MLPPSSATLAAVSSAIHPDISAPCRSGRRTPATRGADRGDVAATKLAYEVPAGRAGRHDVLPLPAEKLGVEAHRTLRIRVNGGNPARNAGLISVALAHLSLLRGSGVVRNPSPMTETARKDKTSSNLTKSSLGAFHTDRRQLCYSYGRNDHASPHDHRVAHR
jgi:hypothetical protein